ncbi:MAG: DUF4910 domain-containing protein [Candidatus Hodarchaeota archaeon]
MKDFTKLIDIVLNEVSGKYALDWVLRISQHNRVVGSQDYHLIVQDIINELESYSLDEIRIHKFPADGKTKIWEWMLTKSWEISSAELQLIEPRKEILCRFQDIPMCVIVRSRGCDLNAEVIDVGKGITEADYEGKEVEGKIVLMEAPRIIVPPFYAEKGALGVIVYPNPQRAAGYKNMTIYNRFPAIAEDLEKSTFGFSITFEQALYLKELLKKGCVKVYAKINAKVYDGELEVISAAIRGTEKPKEEIIFTAHLCHPAAGVNDNASGSGGLIELARSFSALIKQKKIEPPKRTIRFLWVPEFHGTFPWVKEHEEIVKKALLNINLDMIGEHPIEVGEPCEICLAPYSRPSILNDIIQHFTKIIADHPKGIAVNGTHKRMLYRFTPYSGGSDHTIFVDTPIKIPGLMISHNDPYWHSSLDSIEKCDSTELKRVIAISLCTSYIFSILSSEYLIDLWPIIEEGFYKRLGHTKKIIYTLFNQIGLGNNKSEISKDEKFLLGRGIIDVFIDYERQLLDLIKLSLPSTSIVKDLMFEKYNELENLEKAMHSQWNNLGKHLIINIDLVHETDFFNQKWSLAFLGRKNLKFYTQILLSDAYEEFKVPGPPEIWGGEVREMINFIDLSLNLKEISAMLTLEYDHVFYPTNVQKFARFLEDYGEIKRI